MEILSKFWEFIPGYFKAGAGIALLVYFIYVYFNKGLRSQGEVMSKMIQSNALKMQAMYDDLATEHSSCMEENLEMKKDIARNEVKIVSLEGVIANLNIKIDQLSP